MPKATLTRDEDACSAGFEACLAQISPLRVWPGLVVQIYVYCCSACGETVFEHSVYYGTPLTPHPPDKWVKVGDAFYCEKHEVKKLLLVDGKEVHI